MNNINYINHVISTFLLAGLLSFSQAANAGVAGYAQFVNGKVQVISSSGQSYDLKKGGVIHESDTVVTTEGSSAQIKMEDGGFIVVRPNSSLKFDSFAFSGKEDGSEHSFFSLLKGGIRAITGLIGHTNKKNYRINTPNSTIGIRGTDHETFVVTADSPMAAKAPIGTYNKVNRGETTMTTSKGMISILPNQMGFVGSADQLPQLQPINLNIFTVVPPPSLNGSNNGVAVRNDAVMDGVIQDTGPLPETKVPDNPAKVPITTVPGGPTQPKVVF